MNAQWFSSQAAQQAESGIPWHWSLRDSNAKYTQLPETLASSTQGSPCWESTASSST
ncbi:hypothetical protein FB639_006026, partial [Coemansia asiatica]